MKEITTEVLRDWHRRFRDATRENDPDNMVKALYDCRDLLVECFPAMLEEILFMDELDARRTPGAPPPNATRYDRVRVML